MNPHVEVKGSRIIVGDKEHRKRPPFEIELSEAEKREALEHWAQHGPQGPIDEEQPR